MGEKQFIIHSYAVPVDLPQHCDRCKRPAIYTVRIVGADEGIELEAQEVNEHYMQRYYVAQDNDRYTILAEDVLCGGHLCGYYAQTVGEMNAIGLVHAAEDLGRAIVVGRLRGALTRERLDTTVTQVKSHLLSDIVDELETRIRSGEWSEGVIIDKTQQ